MFGRDVRAARIMRSKGYDSDFIVMHFGNRYTAKQINAALEKAKTRKTNYYAQNYQSAHAVTMRGVNYAPPDVWAERDARLSAPRTVTQMICGDPPLMQSALARRV